MRLLVSILFTLLFIACSTGKNNSLIYSSDYCNADFKKVSFTSLFDSLSFYDRKPVEITGFYHSAFEVSVISTQQNFSTDERIVWVDFGNELSDSLTNSKPPNENIFDKIDGKKVKMRGYFSAGRTGHLSGYPCGIRICYLEILR